MEHEFEHLAQELIVAGQYLYRQGLVPATSGNLSARLSNNDIAITVSGRHKGQLTIHDIMRVDPSGRSYDERKPSAETLLHAQIYKTYEYACAVLHPHSLNATVLSRALDNDIVLQNYELLKAFAGITTHEVEICIPVYDNDQDMVRLSNKIALRLAQPQRLYGYVLRGHGFYTWGNSVSEALRHVEALEFLFACELKSGLQKGKN